MEPSYGTLVKTPSNKSSLQHKNSGGANGSSAPNTNSRWSRDKEVDRENYPRLSVVNDGCLLLLSDPNGAFSATNKVKRSNSNEESPGEDSEEAENKGSVEDSKEISGDNADSINLLEHVRFSKFNIAAKHGVDMSSSRPHRGDLVAFMRSSKGGASEVKLLKRSAATLMRGMLTDINVEAQTAMFIVDPSEKTKFSQEIDFNRVVGCKPQVLREGEPVEGIFHENKIFGIARTKDLYATGSTASFGKKERPRLNLTVRKEMGGKIIAQSGMAKGPNGTNGFPSGWTSRVSWYVDGKLDESALQS